jgi:hypothetical protein
MKVFERNFNKKPTPDKKNRADKAPKKIIRILWFCLGVFLLFLIAFSFFSPLIKATKKLDYFDYVSELRSNLLTVNEKDYSLRVYAVEKEYPYVADGIKRETTLRTEIYFTAPTGDESCSVTFTVDGKNYGGEMSYDNVKAEYFYSVSADVSKLERLPVEIVYGKDVLRLTALTVKKATTLTPRALLDALKDNERETFNQLTENNAFVGEIYLRLICEDEPYYYVGLITKDGKMRAYLLTADTGKVLAKRES